MPDSRFFHNSGSLTLSAIASLTGATLTTRGGQAPDGERVFGDVASLEQAGKDDVGFLDNVKYLDAFAKSKAGACFVRPQYVSRAPEGMALLVTPEPYFAHALTASRFYPERETQPVISPQAIVAASATIGKDVTIAPGAIIGENVSLGAHCSIGAYTVIGDGVMIGDHGRIGAHCTVSHAIIGQRIIVHRGVHIGQDGFGFAPGPQGILKVPQLGRVLIGDDVEIGSGTCIDRGAGPDTVIGNHTKIDNLVQIGHNVRIGNYVLIAAQCGISGSTQVGGGVMLGGQVGLAGHLSVGKGAKIAAQSGVMTDVPDGETYGGSPAVPIRDWHRSSVVMAQLIKKKE
jgi:UDP-3-O-[3-hydroxymyristoyl] glucosamine N-acyltransferase